MMTSRIVRLSKKGQMVLPLEIRKALEVEPGDNLLIIFGEGEAVLLPSAQYSRYTRGLLRGTWGRTKEEIDAYLKGERDAWVQE